MKTKIIKGIELIILILIVYFSLKGMKISNITANTSVKFAENYSDTSIGEIILGSDPNSYNYDTHTGTFEALDVNPVYPIPLYDDYAIYCLEPGNPINFAYDIKYATALELSGTTHSSTCGCASTPSNGSITPPVYYEDGTYKLPIAAAYIISDEPIGDWTLQKQFGIWNLRDSVVNVIDENGVIHQQSANVNEDGQELTIGDGHTTMFPDTSSKYDTEAIDYANYDATVRDKGLQPSNETNYNEVTVKVNQDTGKYTIGPLKLNYTNGIYGNVAFAGISKMVVYGYNEKEELIKDNNGKPLEIKIEKFILKDSATGNYGNEVEPQYFEPDETLKIDRSEQVYPSPNQEFQIVISNPNANLSSDAINRIAYVDIKVDFQYMLANGEYTKMKGIKYTVSYRHSHDSHTHKYCTGTGEEQTCTTYSCYSCETTCYLSQNQQQWIMVPDAIRTVYGQELLPEGKILVPLQMDLGGYVWEDTLESKESKADGVINTTGEESDLRLKNVKVSLYEEDGTLATLLSNENESGISSEELMHRVNPTFTDDNGQYLFKGLDPMKKYYVVFEYNGQRYLPTEYLNTANGQYTSANQMVNAGLYNTEAWRVNSKGTETDDFIFDGVKISREDYDERFKEISSYPQNYPSSNNLGWANNGYNAVYTQMDLMGYELDDNGKYVQTKEQLIDGFTYDENGLETDNFKEGVISEKIRKYIEDKKIYPDQKAIKSIYDDIAGEDKELQRKLQFIEDCYIQAYTGSPFSQDMDLYPVYDKFIINEERNGKFDYTIQTYNGEKYYPIYDGQYYVNLGLWRRQEFDNALRKDAYKATLKINDKTVVYNYDKRGNEEGGNNEGNGQDNNSYWDINVRMSDYEKYYNTGYNREIYETDYSYDSTKLNHPGSNLEVYITYKITIRNQSMSVMNQIKEVVDYYDSEYTYKPNLSWVMYQTNKDDRMSVDKDQFYNMMNQSQRVIDDESTSAMDFIDYSLDAKANEGNSRYNNEKNLGNQYKNLYINGLESKKLATGESAYIYLTFEVNKDANGRIILDDESNPKENIAEVNGYITYYADNTELPNGVSKDSNNTAGLLDRDSNPGNLMEKDLQGNKYEKNFEDDTDRAPSLRILIDEEAVRKANGTVWEDERTKNVSDSIIGDGIRQEDEIGIKGVTVQLVEKCINGSEYIWQETMTDANGKYNFEQFIPGDYVIRFYYGDKETTALTTKEQPVSYNGQDFKSTIYQEGIKQSGKTDISGKYDSYTNTENQNESGTYGYDIYKSDSDKTNYSDAKDIWSTVNRNGLEIKGPVQSARLVQGREEVIKYSNENITNHKAEVLASPYQRPSYNGTEYSDEEMKALYKELMDETYMTSETGVIVVEFEYDRQQSDGLKDTENNKDNSSKDYADEDNRHNSNYTLRNIDLGLTERPKAQLEMDKSVANVKVTLANGSILFDINGSANNALWQEHKEYNLEEYKNNGKYEEYYNKNNKHRYSYRDEIDKLIKNTDKGLIQLTMDQELMHGATIQVTYTVKVTNVGEVDYIDDETKDFYYNAEILGANTVTTTANQVVDFVQNNFQFDVSRKENSEAGWKVKTTAELVNENLMNSKLTNNLNEFNTIIQTESFNTSHLKPGEEVSKTLILSQLITPENEEDDLTYSNMTEIVKTSNDVGRRMAYSVVGNQDPTLNEPSEVDTSAAEKIVILPPFGEGRIYYVIGAIVAVILIGGIVLIRRKVLRNK